MPWRWELYDVTETRTLQELKDKYGDATTKKQTKEAMLEQATQQYEVIWDQTCQTLHEAKACIDRLQASALRPTTLSEIDYINLQIEAEKSKAASGWQSRVQFYEMARHRAELEASVAQGKLSPDFVLPRPKIAVHPDSESFIWRIWRRLIQKWRGK
jgi:nitrate/nitrite-specific signal transduction histidine kinase